MGELIDFSARRRPPAERARPETDVSDAQILFFTGVRYERMSEIADAPARDDGPGSSRQRRRKRRD
jgi:hypothetical protein